MTAPLPMIVTGRPVFGTVTVPAPPSTNDLFNKGRRGWYKTPAYKQWRKDAGWTLVAQRPARVLGRVLIFVAVERGQYQRSADIDNCIKALFDLLVEHCVIQDDSLVVGFAASWVPPDPDGGPRHAHISVLPASNINCSFLLAPSGSLGWWAVAV